MILMIIAAASGALAFLNTARAVEKNYGSRWVRGGSDADGNEVRALVCTGVMLLSAAAALL